MKIIFSPAKTLHLNSYNETTVSISNPTRIVLLSLIKSIMPHLYLNTNINSLENIELLKKTNIFDVNNKNNYKKLFKISDKLIDQNLEYIQNLLRCMLNISAEVPQTKRRAYKAVWMYGGMAYQALDVRSLDTFAQEYLDRHLLILSALYGVIPANTNIMPYRLDFNTALKLPLDFIQQYNDEDNKTETISLRKFWKKFYNEYIDKGETVINLASNEFSDLFDKTRYDWYDFDFFNLQEDNSKKRHSTISKKGRGTLLRDMAVHNIQSVNDIKKLPNYGRIYEQL